MKEALVIIDMQNDFIDGSLGTTQAQQIVSNVISKINCFFRFKPKSPRPTKLENLRKIYMKIKKIKKKKNKHTL